MKRVLACLTAALLVLGITACGGAPEEKQPQDDSQIGRASCRERVLVTV